MDSPALIDLTPEGVVRVALTGSVIMVRHDQVLSQVERALKDARSTRVIVDLSDVTSLDSSGVALLVLLQRLAGGVPGFVLERTSPEVRRHLDGVGLTRLLGLQAPEGGGWTA